MNEIENKNTLYAIQALGAILEDKDATIRAKNYRIESLEKEVAALKAKQNTIDKTDKYRFEYIELLEAKVEELEERVAIMSESTGTADMWFVEAPKKSSNVTTVEEDEQ